ncbi:hypothetical protein ACJX0J_032954, partial [Zea mays]
FLQFVFARSVDVIVNHVSNMIFLALFTEAESNMNDLVLGLVVVFEHAMMGMIDFSVGRAIFLMSIFFKSCSSFAFSFLWLFSFLL